jgi:phospholipid/cholesterol/gamma-HCH transport system substrate-binding protein
MRLSNELKVGIAIVIATLVFVVGVRYFANLPLFGGTYQLFAEFADGGGLVTGNPVRINGVVVGQVEQVALDIEQRTVRVRFHVGSDVAIPTGSHASIGGLAVLGQVMLDVQLGPAGNPPIPPGGTIPGRADDPVSDLMARAPGLVGRADTALIAVSQILSETRMMLGDPDSDFRLAMANLRNATSSMNQLVRAEQARVGRVLAGFEETSANLARFSGEAADSVAIAMGNLNRVLVRADTGFASLEIAAARLDTLMARITAGEGTAGLLVNDTTLYYQLDSLVNNLNRMVADFEENPGRYLRQLRLISIF